MKLKKEFSDFYKAIRIDTETNVLKEKREILENDIKTKLPEILSDKDIEVKKSDIRMIDQGSYKYNTTIKDDVVDRDVAVMVPLDIVKNDDPRKIKGYLQTQSISRQERLQLKSHVLEHLITMMERNGFTWICHFTQNMKIICT